MNECGLLQRTNRFTLKTTGSKTELLDFFIHDYDSYLMFTDHESCYIVDGFYIKWN